MLDKIKNLEKFIGNTPLIKISALVDGKEVEVFAKYEAYNFSGSIKDRMALEIIKNGYRTENLADGCLSWSSGTDIHAKLAFY